MLALSEGIGVLAGSVPVFMPRIEGGAAHPVIPAKAGIQNQNRSLRLPPIDSGASKLGRAGLLPQGETHHFVFHGLEGVDRGQADAPQGGQ